MIYDHIIKGGMIVDGTRQPRFRADIAIKDGVIAEIGNLDRAEAREILDASNLIVAPGFIDLHTHYDAQLFWDPYCSLSGWHGVTTVVTSNCGIGFAPVRPEERDRAMLSMTRIEAIPYASMKAALPWDWVTYPEFLDSVARAAKAVNVASFVPVGPLLVWVLGLADAKAGRMPTDEEHAELRRLLHDAMDAGGCGWSLQYTPPSGNFALQRDFDGSSMVTDVMHPETMCELANVLAERNAGCVQMLHMTGDRDRDHAMYEKLAGISGRPLIVTGVAPVDADATQHRHQLAWLRGARERGLRVVTTAQTTRAPYYFKMDEFNLFDNSEVWMEATTGSHEERKAKMADPVRREALRNDVPSVIFELGNVIIRKATLEKNRPMVGQNLTRIARETGRHIVDIFLDIAVEEDLQTEFQSPPSTGNNSQWLKEVVDDPWSLFGNSDGGAHTRFITAGAYTTESIIAFVRDYGWLSLEDTHWRLSTLPALILGLRDRGTLTIGSAADIVVYDLDSLAIRDVETAVDFPANEWRRIVRGSGYRYVLVNGEVTIRDDRETGAYSGRLLRNGVLEKTGSALAAA
jgi:N-acyl-D-amino-acid deacylase